MKLVRTLPVLLGSLAMFTLSLQEGTSQEGRPDDPAPREGRLRPDGDARPAGSGNRDVGRLDVFGRRMTTPADSIVDRIKGGWMLTEMELENSTSTGRTAAGFLHVGDSFLSLEVHAFWTGAAADREYDVHISFTAEYTLDAAGELRCRSIIGSYLDEETGLLEWEGAGFPRIYDVSETESELVLRWGGNRNRLVFRPRPPMMRGTVDIFGRHRRVEPGEASLDTDIFGRSLPDEGGVRDIFGRKIAPDETAAENAGDGEDAKEGADPPHETPPDDGR